MSGNVSKTDRFEDVLGGGRVQGGGDSEGGREAGLQVPKTSCSGLKRRQMSSAGRPLLSWYSLALLFVFGWAILFN